MLYRAIFISSICIIVSAADDTLNFLLLGDWGKGGTSGSYWNSQGSTGLNDDEVVRSQAKNQVLYQTAVASSMAKYANNVQPSPQFILALGDNFYTKGVQSTNDAGWTLLWQDVYLTYSSLRIPWYPVFGNHDYNGVPQAQIDFTYSSYNVNKYWNFPAYNYTRTFDIPGGGEVQIVFIDTTTLAPSVTKATRSEGGISTDVQNQRIINQLTNIKRILDRAKAYPPTWLLVVGHYPVYSIGTHGDTSELTQYGALLQSYGVHAYICGHDHISEHLRLNNVEYFVAGAGSMSDTTGNVASAAEVVWTGTGYSAFAAMTATTSTLTINYIDTNGDVKYTYSLNNPNKKDTTAPPTQPPAEFYTNYAKPNGNTAIILYSIFSMFGFVVLVLTFNIHRNRYKRRYNLENTVTDWSATDFSPTDATSVTFETAETTNFSNDEELFLPAKKFSPSNRATSNNTTPHRKTNPALFSSIAYHLTSSIRHYDGSHGNIRTNLSPSSNMRQKHHQRSQTTPF